MGNPPSTVIAPLPLPSAFISFHSPSRFISSSRSSVSVPIAVDPDPRPLLSLIISVLLVRAVCSSLPPSLPLETKLFSQLSAFKGKRPQLPAELSGTRASAIPRFAANSRAFPTPLPYLIDNIQSRTPLFIPRWHRYFNILGKTSADRSLIPFLLYLYSIPNTRLSVLFLRASLTRSRIDEYFFFFFHSTKKLFHPVRDARFSPIERERYNNAAVYSWKIERGAVRV